MEKPHYLLQIRIMTNLQVKVGVEYLLGIPSSESSALYFVA